ncbi:MAG: class I SAM-dependent methyltransferase [Variovorax sp.]|nr:class I SAM-dependent methyltransferase [Variovorax sp.]|tara:strand:+ start:1230 stop:2321 length:1092 start_codon:yes stop_codon:yes gene_type:complete
MIMEISPQTCTIADLYKSNGGKVSDKWELYLREYERLLAPYRGKAVSLLEIGIQNGGSLERWAQYFPEGTSFIGCDINETCRALRYGDERISVVVGDANAPEVAAQILGRSADFDIIIDDGSHRSSDVIKSFARFFPALKEGGVFIAEDMHCSYWKDYEGGLFYPLSAVAFFKRLADITSHEHWGVPLARHAVLAPFVDAYGEEFNEECLRTIHSVEFVNSMCVVTKQPVATNTLGRRIVSGHEDLVWPGAKALHLQPHVAVVETGNEWSDISRLPEAERARLLAALEAREAERDGLVERAKDARALIAEAARRESELEAQVLTERSAHKAAQQALLREVQELRRSTSWRITAPLRALRSLFK